MAFEGGDDVRYRPPVGRVVVKIRRVVSEKNKSGTLEIAKYIILPFGRRIDPEDVVFSVFLLRGVPTQVGCI